MALYFDARERLQPQEPTEAFPAASGLVGRIDGLEAVEIRVGEADAAVDHGEGFDRPWLTLQAALPLRDDPNYVVFATGLLDRLERVHDSLEERKESFCLRKIGVADAAGNAGFHGAGVLA
ncbi:hypothetical protein HB777_22200 [Mesorhizobium loti]|nr:hypothetical protein HB777_22200 [Mesorhizobium loti]